MTREALPSGVTWRNDPWFAISVVAILATLSLRLWALVESWFFSDDYRLLLEAIETPLTPTSLFDPFDSQFMPLGLLLVEIVASSGELNWHAAVTLNLLANAVAASACLYMLHTLFGRGWPTALLLVLYLTTCITTPALMWWAAALNQVPPQACLFLAVAWWVNYLRTSRLLWAVGTVAALVVALGFYVKALLIVPALAVVTLAHFYRGNLPTRLRSLVQDQWRVLVPALLVPVAYGIYYQLRVPQPFAGSDASKVAEVADSLLGKAVPTGLLGGPWRWWETNPPIVLANPPAWTVSLAWTVLALVVAYSLLRRSNTWPAWCLLGFHAVADFALLATSRGQEYGALAGMDYRYLTDLAPVAVLCLGLAFLTLRGAPNPSQPRPSPVLSYAIPPVAVGGLSSVVIIGGLNSSVDYIHFWHHQHAAKVYVPTMADELRKAAPAHLINQTLPGNVMPDYTFPMNQTSSFVTLVDAPVSFPESSTEFLMLDPTGTPRPATVQPDVTSGQGPIEGCGWSVGSTPQVLRLSGRTFAWEWWARAGVLASSRTTLVMRFGDETHEVDVPSGLSDAMVRVHGAFDSVTVRVEGGGRVCVDRVDVGRAVPRS